MDIVLGIDLGTTFSSVSYVDQDGNVNLIKNSVDEYITPSAVYFHKGNDNDKEIIIGKKAKEKAKQDPDYLVEFVKREIGKDKMEVRYNKIDEEYCPYEFFGRIYSPEEISGYILAQMKKDAEKQLARELSKAVITVPAYFGSKEKESTREAGIIAGLEVLEIIPEPTAAALAYGAISLDKSEKIFVFDLGGGTFDVTILEIIEEKYGKNIKMIATDGNHRLGGIDWDKKIMLYAVEQFEEKFGLDLFFEESEEAKQVLGKLRIDAERAKIQLSQVKSTQLHISYGGQSLNIPFMRAQFEEITTDLIEELGTYSNNVLSDSGHAWHDIDKILLVGSMCNMPSVQAAVQEWSGRDVRVGIVNPKTCVSQGAAIMAYIKSGGNTISSTINQVGYDRIGKELNQQEIEKAEKKTKRAVCTFPEKPKNIIPASLGVLAKNRIGEEVVAKLIPKNTPYPVEKKERFGCFDDGLKNIEIRIVEGESNNPLKVQTLGVLHLPLEGYLKKGDPIEVTFMYDDNGILQVKARDVKNDNEILSRIKRKGALSEDDIESAKNELNMLFLG